MKAVTLQKISLRLIGFVGAAIFSVFFALTFSIPGWVENFAADYIESKARERIDVTIDSVRPPQGKSAIAQLAQSMYDRNEAKMDGLKSQLKSKVHERWAQALAEIRNLDCECREEWEDWFERGFQVDIALLREANEEISTFIHSSYMDVATELKRDIRIFTASNAAVFVLLLLVSFFKPGAMVHLFLPGVLLALSTVVCSYFYLFEQNWLLTVIHSSYVGFAYLAWLGFVFLFLCDIVFNRGRVTTEIINGISNALGSALSVVPC